MRAKASELQRRVDEALDNAVFENQYTDLMVSDPRELAVDLLLYSSMFSSESLEDVVECVRDYQRWYERVGKDSHHPKQLLH